MEAPSILHGESRKRRPAEYFRFEGVANAIRFSIEGLPSPTSRLGKQDSAAAKYAATIAPSFHSRDVSPPDLR
jgi:hypothetical protein